MGRHAMLLHPRCFQRDHRPAHRISDAFPSHAQPSDAVPSDAESSDPLPSAGPAQRRASPGSSPRSIAPNQRQGRTLHPIRHTPMGSWPRLSRLGLALCRLAFMASLLPPASATLRDWRPSTSITPPPQPRQTLEPPQRKQRCPRLPPRPRSERDAQNPASGEACRRRLCLRHLICRTEGRPQAEPWRPPTGDAKPFIAVKKLASGVSSPPSTLEKIARRPFRAFAPFFRDSIFAFASPC